MANVYLVFDSEDGSVVQLDEPPCENLLEAIKNGSQMQIVQIRQGNLVGDPTQVDVFNYDNHDYEAIDIVDDQKETFNLEVDDEE